MLGAFITSYNSDISITFLLLQIRKMKVKKAPKVSQDI